MKGAAAIEKGGKNQREHIQAVIMCSIPTDKNSESKLKQHFKDWMSIDSSDRAKLTFKPLGESQTFEHMLGYVQKDLGKPHYRLVTYDVTSAELEAGRKAYADVSGDYKAGKIVLSKTALAERIWSFWNANYKPFIVPMDVILLHMIMSGKYCPCGTWCSAPYGQRIDLEIASAWMLMVMRPAAVHLDHIRMVFWGDTGRSRWRDTRYFKPAVPDFKTTLTAAQQAIMQMWYEHAYDVEVMAQVVVDLRSCLQLLNISFDNYEQVDQTFVVGFHAAYDAANNMSHRTAAFNPPADCLTEAEELGGALQDHFDAIQDAIEEGAVDDDDMLLAGLCNED